MKLKVRIEQWFSTFLVYRLHNTVKTMRIPEELLSVFTGIFCVRN